MENFEEKSRTHADGHGQPPQSGKVRAIPPATSCDGEAESAEIFAAKPRRGTDDRGQHSQAGKVRVTSLVASHQATESVGSEPCPWNEGEEGDDDSVAVHPVTASIRNPEREARGESEMDLKKITTVTERREESSSCGSDKTELEAMISDKNGTYPAEVGKDTEGGMTGAERLQESSIGKFDKTERRPSAVDMAKTILRGDFAPTEKSLVAYCEVGRLLILITCCSFDVHC